LCACRRSPRRTNGTESRPCLDGNPSAAGRARSCTPCASRPKCSGRFAAPSANTVLPPSTSRRRRRGTLWTKRATAVLNATRRIIRSDPGIRRTAIATTISPVGDPPVEACLAQLLDHLGIAGAHFAGRSLADVQGFIAKHSERIASLTLVCPTVLNPHSLAPLGARLLVVTGDHGLGARRVQAVLPALPEATAVVLDDYAGLTWADLAADRGERIDTAMREFLQHRDPLPSAGLSEQQGETAGISFRIRGAGPPLVLLPLDLSPGQWEPLIPTLSARHCTITLGGPLFGSVASLEERGRSGYMAVVRGLLDALAIRPGESVLEVGCGSGVIVRELARRTAGANRLIGRDINAYLLREARALARRAGLLDQIDFGEGRAEALPLPDAAVDVALSSTVFEEGDAERMLAEIVRVTRPGGRIGIVVRAVDMPFWVNLPLDPALKAKVDAPNVIGGGVAPKGVADASLYRRLSAHGLTGLKCFPQLVSVVPGSERIERYQQQILAALTPAEAATWHLAVAAAERDGTFFIAQSYHCAVATKPG
jgi:ubiquinone/menaquinone biosynthesis C-methylase UbiE